MREGVTISYRGANYEIGQGPGFYGIWAAEIPGRPQPLEWWPQTPEGWHGAWSRFAGIEAPGTIVPVSQYRAPVRGQHPAAGGETTFPEGQPAALAGQPTPPAGQPTTLADRSKAPAGRPGVPAVIAAALIGIGVVCGIAGLFPDYFGGASIAQQPVELVPHVIYLAVWSASAVLILLGGVRLRMGALAGLGTSVVTFGLFLADLGQAIAGGTSAIGAGLVLGLAGWLACTVGSVAAFRLRPAGAGGPGGPARPQPHEAGLVLALTLAALGTAVAFAPSWDRYTLHTSAGLVQSLTEGNAFANPAPVIAGNVAVMVALVAVVVAAALWRPAREGAALLAGAIIPMAAQAISALVQLGEATSPAQLGISPAQAAQAGLTISSGATPEFWIYCGFVVALGVLTCARVLTRPPAVTLSSTQRVPSAVS